MATLSLPFGGLSPAAERLLQTDRALRIAQRRALGSEAQFPATWQVLVDLAARPVATHVDTLTADVALPLERTQVFQALAVLTERGLAEMGSEPGVPPLAQLTITAKGLRVLADIVDQAISAVAAVNG